MCGICGFWRAEGREGSYEQVLQKMLEAIAHRGPDSSGYKISVGGAPLLAHARLSIMDVSAAGSQPMDSAGGRYTIVYNGEIYNHLLLRTLLEKDGLAPIWRGHSDTETILACCEAWGLEATLDKMVGMYAFVLWDSKLDKLIVVRDRLGEKPVYYGFIDDSFVFSSEISSFHFFPGFNQTVDQDAVVSLLQRSYVPAPISIYSQIKKLQPGYVLTVTRCSASGSMKGELSPYWRLVDQLEKGRGRQFLGGLDKSVNAFDKLMTEVVESQMISDVPLGAFLSGGVDSSLIVAMMKKISTHPVKTFSIGFDDKQFDESESARRVADYLGTEHEELVVTPEHIMAMIPNIPSIYSEPFADSSQLPTYLVSKMAKEHVSVVLTGDGADELFGGYNRYIGASKVWDHASRIPSCVRSSIGDVLLSIPKTTLDVFFGLAFRLISNSYDARLPGDKVHKIARLLKKKTRSDYYESLISMTDDPVSFVTQGSLRNSLIDDAPCLSDFEDFESWMMVMDALTYLPDDICVKVDRASMANSLETRAPFLDRRIVEFSAALPIKYKIDGGVSKNILRETLSDYVPRHLFERPKMGFGIPFGKWLRGPLYDWAENLLNEERLASDALLNPARVREVWLMHQSSKGNYEYLLWNILMFNCWLDRWRGLHIDMSDQLKIVSV